MIPIAHVEFTDGITRPVYEDAQGQFTFDNEGELIRGVWFVPRDQAAEPIIVGDATTDPDF